jgi:quercetin dioxygenase-like cupin family protein
VGYFCGGEDSDRIESRERQKGKQRKTMPTTTREEIRFGGLVIRYLVDPQASGGSVAMFEFEVAPGAKVPAAHSHDAYEETAYGLEGTLTYTVNGQTMEGGPGDSVLIPRGAVHRFENLHSAPAKALAIITPGLLGPDYFREIAAVLQSAPAGSPPNAAVIGEIMRRHGLTPAS